MYIQGDLQKVFDALYNMGVIDPVLDSNWVKERKELVNHLGEYEAAVEVINSHSGGLDELVEKLKKHDEKVLGFLAMEVAREFSYFHERKEVH